MWRLVLAYLTFPGIIAHEFGHAWACRCLGIRVQRVCYLRLGNPPGYVLHEQPRSATAHILVAIAPFFVSTALGLAISTAVCVLRLIPGLPEPPLPALVTACWLSFSCCLHAFPSSGDADALWRDVTEARTGIFSAALLVPVVGLIRLVRLATRTGLDIVFALAVMAVPPTLLVTATI